MDTRKIDVAWDGNPEAKENMAAYNNTVVEPKMAMDLASAANTYYMTKPQDDHPWRGKSAFGFATILNRNSCDDMGANGPLSVNLPPLQSYHASSLVDKAKLTTSSRLSAHKVPHRPMPTPIAPLGEAMVDMSGLQNRSLKLKIKKKHVDISPAYTAQPNGPMLAPTPSNGAPRKLPLAPAPSMDDDDDDSGEDDGENPTGATHNGAALRGGRWTSEEHERFLQGFRLHGHKWKRVQMVVRSRTVTQVRTHAQKYLLKLQKMSGGPEQQRSTTATSGGDADGRFLAPSQFGSGATSPTQSMTSGNDDEAAHDKVATTVNELGQPLSPRSAVTLQTLQPRKLKTMKKQQQQKRTTKRSDLDGSSLVHIEEAAYTLCALMKEHIDDLEAIVTDHEDDGMEVDDDNGTESTEDESMDSSSSPVSSADMKKRYLCRKCRVPKKGHVCPEASSGEDSGAKSLSLKKMSLHESDLDCYEPLEAEWNDLDKYVGYRVARCFGPNLWCRGTIDQVVSTGSDQDKIHIVYSEASGRHEWLLKSDAIECIAIEGLNTDDDEAYGVFAGSSLRKRKHWNSLASSLRESPEKDDDFEDDDDDATAAHPAKRLCSP